MATWSVRVKKWTVATRRRMTTMRISAQRSQMARRTCSSTNSKFWCSLQLSNRLTKTRMGRLESFTNWLKRGITTKEARTTISMHLQPQLSTCRAACPNKGIQTATIAPRSVTRAISQTSQESTICFFDQQQARAITAAGAAHGKISKIAIASPPRRPIVPDRKMERSRHNRQTRTLCRTPKLVGEATPSSSNSPSIKRGPRLLLGKTPRHRVLWSNNWPSTPWEMTNWST